MGCDIHLAVERRMAHGWERAHPPEHARCPWLVEQAAKHPGDSYYARRAPVTWYDGRNYVLFGVLANVRNGYGFAGIPTGNAVVPIAEPRGYPDDLCPSLKAIAEERGDEDDIWLGDHSHTWLLLSEVLAYDWDQRKQRVGVVSFEQFAARIDKHGTALPLHVDTDPYETWSGGISGPGISTMEAAEAIRSLKDAGIAQRKGDRLHVRDSWSTPLRTQVKDFLDRVVPALRDVDPNPANVRLVFGFDS